MNTILVWVLVSVGGYGGNQVTYSPSFADLESCQRTQQAAKDLVNTTVNSVRSQCVQVKVVK